MSDFLDEMDKKYPLIVKNVYGGVYINKGWERIVDHALGVMNEILKRDREDYVRFLLASRSIRNYQITGNDQWIKSFLKFDKNGQYDWCKTIYSEMVNVQQVPSQYCVVTEKPELHVVQIKEKFGQLRMYVDSNLYHKVEGVIVMAEAVSSYTCEMCGNHEGKLQSNGWLTVQCDSCYSKRKKV